MALNLLKWLPPIRLTKYEKKMKQTKGFILLILLMLSQQTFAINSKYFLAHLIVGLQIATPSYGVQMLPDQPPVLLPKLENELKEAGFYRSNYLTGHHKRKNFREKEDSSKSASSSKISTVILLTSFLISGTPT